MYEENFKMANLRILQCLHRCIKGTAQRGEVDHDIHVGVAGHSLGHLLVHRNHDLLGAPVEPLLVVSAAV